MRGLRFAAVLALALAFAVPVAFGSSGDSSPHSDGDRLCFGREPTMVGTDGADILIGGPDTDVIVGGNGKDLIIGGGGRDFLCGEGGADEIHGRGGGDKINGGGGNDMLFGDGGNDRLLGKRGDDFIDGGNKDDVANGAGGTDHCIAETQKKCESGPTAHGLDWQFGIAGQALEVTVGDSVTWTWTDGLPHTIWGSGVETAPHTHTEEFDSIGVFPYMCTIHPSMTGAITVVAP